MKTSKKHNKLFNIDLVELPKVKRKNINGKRHYFLVDDETPVYYPSVTTVISSDPASIAGIQNWRRRVGAEEANKISRQAAARGTKSHQLIEDYIQGKEPSDAYKYNSLDMDLFGRLKVVADKRVDNIRCIEGQLFSHTLQCSGTVDMVADFDGVLSVVDWKTSLREKKRDYIKNYFMQESAYAVMFHEATGIPVNQLVTVISTEEGETQVFVEKLEDWIYEFIRLRNFYEETK